MSKFFLIFLTNFTFFHCFSYFEENDKISNIISSMRNININKDIDLIYIKLENNEICNSDFYKFNEDFFINIFNSKKSKNISKLIKDKDNNCYLSSRFNNNNLVNLKNINPFQKSHKIEFFDNGISQLNVSESINFRFLEQISLFTSKDFTNNDSTINNCKILNYIKIYTKNNNKKYFGFIFDISNISNAKITDSEECKIIIENNKTTTYYKFFDYSSQFYYSWTFFTHYNDELLYFEEKVNELSNNIFINIFENTIENFQHLFRKHEVFIFKKYLFLIFKIADIFQSTVKNLNSVISEIFPFHINEELNEIWKILKKKIILTFAMLESFKYYSSNNILESIINLDLKALGQFLEKNKELSYKMSQKGRSMYNYIFTIITGLIFLALIIYMIINSPKLKDKKFV